MDGGDWLLSVVTLLIGLVAGAGIEWKQDTRQHKRDREDRRTDAQRQTLEELQRSLEDAHRGAVMMSLVRRLPEHQAVAMGVLGRPPAEMPWMLNATNAAWRIASLAARIKSDDLRLHVYALQAAIGVLQETHDLASADQAMEIVTGRYHATNDLAGQLIRDL